MWQGNEIEHGKMSFCISEGNNQKCTTAKDVWLKKQFKICVIADRKLGMKWQGTWGKAVIFRHYTQNHFRASCLLWLQYDCTSGQTVMKDVGKTGGNLEYNSITNTL